MDGHYDRNANIAWLRLEGWDQDRIRAEESGAGLIERDRVDGRVLGIELWNASERLPAVLFDALPSPPARDVVIEREPVS